MKNGTGLCNLKQIREHYSITPERLAQEIGVKRYQVADWEQGRSSPSIEQLRALSFYFSKSINFLTDYVDYHYSPVIGSLDVDSETARFIEETFDQNCKI